MEVQAESRRQGNASHELLKALSEALLSRDSYINVYLHACNAALIAAIFTSQVQVSTSVCLYEEG